MLLFLVCTRESQSYLNNSCSHSTREYLTKALSALKEQIEILEFELESLAGKKKGKPETTRAQAIADFVKRHKFHERVRARACLCIGVFSFLSSVRNLFCKHRRSRKRCVCWRTRRSRRRKSRRCKKISTTTSRATRSPISSTTTSRFTRRSGCLPKTSCVKTTPWLVGVDLARSLLLLQFCCLFVVVCFRLFAITIIFF